MTVQYNRKLLNVQRMNRGLLRLMFLWKGSVYKMIWPELLIFCILYSLLSVSYHFILNEANKNEFEMIAKYCDQFSKKLPLSFILGFFAGTVIQRFWDQFDAVMWPIDISFKVGVLISGEDQEGRMLRRTMIRYACLGFMMSLCSISSSMHKKFPTLDHLINAGYLLPNEKAILDKMSSKLDKFFVPFVWASLLLVKARKDNRIDSTLATNSIMETFNICRGKCGYLTTVDAYTIPLAYTQVVIIAVYIFCASCLLGRYKFDNGDQTEFHLPLMTIFQFIFYVGWLKVSLAGLQAFGDDDDNFEFESLIEAHLHDGYNVVDILHNKLPEIEMDLYWDKQNVFLPYTLSSLKTMKTIYIGSAAKLNTPTKAHKIVHLSPKV